MREIELQVGISIQLSSSAWYILVISKSLLGTQQKDGLQTKSTQSKHGMKFRVILI